MCRSGFGEQEGHFELLVEGLEAIEEQKILPKEKTPTEVREEKSITSDKKTSSDQADAYYVPVEEQSEEDKTWMRVALDMVSFRFGSSQPFRSVSGPGLTPSIVPFFLCCRMTYS